FDARTVHGAAALALALPARLAVCLALSGRPPAFDAARFSARRTVARRRQPARLRRHAGLRQMDLQHQRAADAVFPRTPGTAPAPCSARRTRLPRPDDRPGLLLQRRGVE